MLAHSFLIESSSKLLVTRTVIKARMSWFRASGFHGPFICFLKWDWQDRHKNLVVFDFGLNQTTHFGVTCSWVTKSSHFWLWISLKQAGQSWSNFMCNIVGVGERLLRFWGRLDQNSSFHGSRSPHWLVMGKIMSPPFLGWFWSDPSNTCR